MADIVDILVDKIEELVTIDVTTNETIVNISTISGSLVDSVNGQTGDVVLDADDIAETASRFWLTSALKTAYDSVVTWISTNGTNLLNHLSNTSNPHSTTATQVDALKRDGSNANSNIDIGEYELKAGQIEFDQTPTGAAGEAVMRWNDQDGTVDLGLKGGNVTLQIGQESVIRVVNKTGTNLLEANYQVVRVDGAQGNRLKIALAQATTDLLSAETIGLVTETINDNQEGFVTTNGLVRNINTTGSLQGETWADGDMLYLSPTVAGRLTKVKPTAPNHLVVIGYVVRAHATQGQIFVKVDNGYELDELHNVAITSPANNNVLTYNSSTEVWENKTVVQALGYTPAPNFYSLKVTTPSAYVTGTLSETEVLRVVIPANTFSANDVLKFPSVMLSKIGTNGAFGVRVKLTTSVTMPSGSTNQIMGHSAIASSGLSTAFSKTFFLNSGNLKGIGLVNSINTDIGNFTQQVSSQAFDHTVTQYLYVSVQLANINDQVRFEGLQLTNY